MKISPIECLDTWYGKKGNKSRRRTLYKQVKGKYTLMAKTPENKLKTAKFYNVGDMLDTYC